MVRIISLMPLSIMTRRDMVGPIVRLTLTGDEMLILGNAEDCEELVSELSSK